MQQKIPITIHLEGAGVEDGSILVEDLVPALQGFASAYGKLASGYSQNLNHKIRVESFTPGSFFVNLYTTIVEHQDALQVGANLMAVGGGGGTIAYRVIEFIVKAIRAKKHIKNQPYTQQTTNNYNNSTVVIVNAENLELEVPLEVYQIMKEKTIDADLSKLASIIDDENIEKLSIAYKKDNEEISESIDSHDKKFFDVDNEIISETRDVWVTCKINTLTKSTNRGQAYLSNGSRVGFKLVAETPENLYRHFVHKGWVKMYCKAKLDENLNPVELEVFNIEDLETELPFGTSQ